MQENKFATIFKQNAIWLVFIVEIAIFAYFNPKFLSVPNIVNISRQVSYYGIASIGMTFVILIAGIDLSIGSIIALVNVVCAYLMMNMHWNMWLAIIVSISVGWSRQSESRQSLLRLLHRRFSEVALICFQVVFLFLV